MSRNQAVPTESRSSRSSIRMLVGAGALITVLAACVPPSTAPGSTTTTEAPTTTAPTTTAPTTTAAPAAPALVVSSTSGLAATGSTVTVTGTGFDPSLVSGSLAGLYVAFGTGAASVPTTFNGSGKFVRPTGPAIETATGAKINADGTFSATVAAPALFAKSGATVNCYIVACNVYVWSAHAGAYAPWTFAPSSVTFAPPTAPIVVVGKTAGLNPAGDSVNVTGAGFSPTGTGIYVAFLPVNSTTAADWWLIDNSYSASWLNAATLASSGGTFSLSRAVIGAFTGGDSVDYDCTTSVCSVVTFKAHGSSDRTQDVITPVAFAAPVA